MTRSRSPEPDLAPDPACPECEHAALHTDHDRLRVALQRIEELCTRPAVPRTERLSQIYAVAMGARS